MIAITLSAALVFAPQNSLTFGDATCGTWVANPAANNEIRAYVMGLWSGRNTGLMLEVGHSTNGDGVVEEVRLVCRATPSLHIVTATIQVYERFRREGR